MNLNILLRGQSNSIILGQLAGADAVAAEVQKLLGFDGVTDKVTLLFKEFDGTGSSTAASGTALIGDWLTPTTVNGQAGWTPNTYEQGLLNYVGGLSATTKADPTVVLWLHSEYDSADSTLTADTWMSAVRYDAAQLRAAFTGVLPYVFVEPIPLDAGKDAGTQAIRMGMEALVADSAFNARLTASSDDLAMNGVFRGAAGHMSDADAALVADRAARSIAEAFAAFAKPGSALASGNIDDTGPTAVQAQQIGAREVSVSLLFDGATTLQALDPDAATGIGWKAIAGSTVLEATGVSLGANNTLLVGFGADLPAGARLYYGYGDSHLRGATADASGNAIYDDQGMPLRSPAVGLVIGASAVQPGVTQAGTDNVDTLLAGPNGDTLIGGKGDDFLVGGAGADTFAFGLGDGNDWVDGFTPGKDHIRFGAGITAKDVLITPLNLGVDGLGVIYGPNGDGIFLAGVTALQAGDLLYAVPPVPPGQLVLGTQNDDSFGAGNGGDTIVGGQGNDYMVSGDGKDVFGFMPGDGPDWVANFDSGSDTLRFGGGLTLADISTEATTLAGVGGLAVRYGPGVADVVFLEAITSLAAGDITFGTVPAVAVDQPRFLTGTAGPDLLAGGGASDTLLGLGGQDTLLGGGSDDVIYAYANDSISGGAGRDVLYMVDDTPAALAIDVAQIEYVAAGFGSDTISGTGQTQAIEVYASGGDDSVTGGSGNDWLWGSVGNDTLIGNGGDDVIVGDLGADSLAGGAGNDRIYVDAGDTIDGGAGFDAAYIVGGAGMAINLAATGLEWVTDFVAGADTLDASGTTTGIELYAGGGNDLLTGGSGADLIFAGEGADTLIGGEGDDGLIGEAGADSISGGLGNDRIYADATDTVDGGDGYDIMYMGTDAAFTVDLGAIRVEWLFAGAGNDSVSSSTATPIQVYANAGADTLSGGGGNDTLWGGEGADSIAGNAGADTLVGEAGADTIAGGAGDDGLFGGDGADVFVFGAAWGNDTIFDWQDGSDLIDVRALAPLGVQDIGGLTIAASGTNAVVGYDGNTLTIIGAAGLIVAADFLFA
ncbi:calcium-binding protein [Dankookia sp. GCM10030260]|uniref:calcium-binding protein n=1 Tax=Dankookia sp. GCM10030260 TaxID=3273390 RepID=UPI00360F7928